MTKFKDFPVSDAIFKAIDELGFTEPTPIQAQAMPVLLSDKMTDFHGQAQTGTGKTLAFGIPLINQIDTKQKAVQALIVAPTRELVGQICDSIKSVGKYSGVKIETIYGGVSIENQIHALRKGAHIIVGTPGRLNDHLRRKTLSLQSLRTLVLDEADLMLDMGFKEEIDEILPYTPKEKQVWLFSATVKPGIQDLKKKYLKDPISISTQTQTVATSSTKQFFCVVPMTHRLRVLMRFIDSTPDFYGFIFCRTKILTSEVAQALTQGGYSAEALHGDMSQPLRNSVIKKFKAKKCTIMVATDVAARGIDVADLTHVINYSLPEDQEGYVHRIGRTGRAGKEGTAISFINRHEIRRISQLGKKFKTTINPIEVPRIEAVLNAHFNKIQTYIGPEANGMAADKLRTLLDGYSKDELVGGMINVLCDTILKDYTEHDDIALPSYDMKKELTRNNNDYQEIMLSLGALDGITKRDVIQYLTKFAKLNSQDIRTIRIIKKRTFVKVPSNISSKNLRNVRGSSLRGKRVSMSLA